MRHASEAGMRYFVITAKHHDGFAMYPSDAYPYDIRLSKFQKDPMEALSRAAKKYGIKFGFYYSHAFDWEHPDAPGNDWDYPTNPGGDKLVGGKNWWLERKDFLANAEKYVNEIHSANTGTYQKVRPRHLMVRYSAEASALSQYPHTGSYPPSGPTKQNRRKRTTSTFWL